MDELAIYCVSTREDTAAMMARAICAKKCWMRDQAVVS